MRTGRERMLGVHADMMALVGSHCWREQVELGG
jgi:hypothetical protein